MHHTVTNRRGFLRRAATTTLASAAGPWAMNLAAMADAAAATGPDDYKALVCVFLQGGNDHANTLIPVDPPSHAQYQAARPTLAEPLAALQATTLVPANPPSSGRQMALAPGLAPLKPLFDDGRLAVLLNIGPLHGPTTKADFELNRSLPPKLFSHNDQQAVWQSSQAEGASAGWGGIIGERGLPPPPARLPRDNLACINVSSHAVFLEGEASGQYMVDVLGVPPLRTSAGTFFGVPDLPLALKALALDVAADAQAHWMARHHAQVMQRALATNLVLRQALDAPGAVVAPLPLPSTAAEFEPLWLALQLNTVARLIEARQRLGLQRQVFFVALGGFDHHDNLRALHPVLLSRVGVALGAFQADLDRLGVGGQVTTFTASDFGRTMYSNGDGSDHGWGSHHFVMGGAVRGRRFYGELPDVVGGATDIGQGRLLPTMAVDHLSAALARWMGISDPATLARVAPHLGAWGAAANPLAQLLG